MNSFVIFANEKYQLHFSLTIEAHSFPRASLSENFSLLGTDNVRGQISEHIFAPNEGYCLFNFYALYPGALNGFCL